MSDSGQQPVLRRKAGARRAAQGLPEMTPAKAMRLAVAKAGDALLCTTVALRELTQATEVPDTLAASLQEPALFLRLSGPDEAVGLAVACVQTVAAVIEAQLMGKVQARRAADRTPTVTDATMLQPFVQRTLDGFAGWAADCRGLPALDGYEPAGRLPDARVALMTLADAPHLRLSLDMDFAQGAKSGTLQLILPARPRTGASSPDAGASAGWGPAMERAVLNSSARLEARLCRFRLPLNEVTGLAVGQVVPLTGARLETLELRAANGSHICTARLGRSGPMRAVRICTDGARPAAPTIAAAVPAAPPAAAPAARPPGPAPVADLPAKVAPVPMDLPE